MEQSYTGRRTLLPKPQPHVQGIQSLSAQPLTTSLSTATIPVQPVSRQPKSNTKTGQEWEHQRPNIEQLYVTDDLSLPDVMREMEVKYHFKASRKQYNNKISQWRIGKNVKTNEMRAIIRKTRQRKTENPPKASVFRVRSRPVDPDKIERFKKDKGIGDDVVMADAATPSDISCNTPPVRDSKITEKSPGSAFIDYPQNPLSPVEPRVLASSYQQPFSSDIPAKSSILDLCQPDCSHLSPSNSLDLKHRLPSSSPRGSRRSPVYWRKSMSGILQSRPRLGSHSPVYWRTSPSPVLGLATSSRYSLSPYPGHQALSGFANSSKYPITSGPAVSEFDWFDAFVNYSDRSRPSSRATLENCIADLVRGLIPQLHTYEDQKEHEELEFYWSIIKSRLVVDGSVYDGCDGCKAWCAAEQLEHFLHLQNEHSWDLPYTINQDFPISEVLRTFLPWIESDEMEGLELGQSAARLLFASGRHQDGESVARATIQELERRTSLDIDIKESVTLVLADILTRYGRHEMAEQLVQDVLKGDFGTIARMAAGVDLLEMETYLGDIEDISWVNGPALTAKELEDIYAMLGEEGVPKMPIYLLALSVLSKLNAHHVEELVMDEEDVMDEEEVMNEEEVTDEGKVTVETL